MSSLRPSHVDERNASSPDDLAPLVDGERLRVRDLVRRVAGRAHRRVVTLLLALDDWATSSKKSVYGFAILRMIAAVAVVGFLITNFSSRLYVFGSGAAWINHFEEPSSVFNTMPGFGLVYAVVQDDTLFTVLYCVAIAVGFAVLVGFFTRVSVTVLLVLWVGIVELNAFVGDQSDNISRIILLFLIFADSGARWSVDARRREHFAGRPGNRAVRLWRQQVVLPAWAGNAVHNTVLVLLVYQLIVVYLAGGLFKAAGEKWKNGTAVWSPLNLDVYTAWPWFNDLLLAWGPMVAAGTVGTVMLQVSFPFMLLRRWTRIIAVGGLVSFHLAIALGMSLVWFSMWMFAIDALLISDRTYLAVARTIRRMLPRRGPRPSAERKEDVHVPV